MDQYLINLEARDKREQEQKRFIEQYTQLADRFADSANQASEPPQTALDAPPPGTTPPPPSDVSSLRLSLATAQKARSALEAEIAAYSPLRQENQQHQKTIDGLNREVLGLQRKLRDRTEELQAKKKMIENVQDEMISQQIELNMCEEKLKKLQNENKDLIARWMDKMGEEADQMNRQSNW